MPCAIYCISILLNEDLRWVQKAVQQPQQGQCTNWDNALQKALIWNDIWGSYPSIIKQTRIRPDIVIHSFSTQKLIVMALTVPYKSRIEKAHTYKREKYLNLTKELKDAGYKAVVVPVEVGA